MSVVAVEMFRGDEWMQVAYRASWGPYVSVDSEGRITITYRIGHVQPPWRVRDGDSVIFERSA